MRVFTEQEKYDIKQMVLKDFDPNIDEKKYLNAIELQAALMLIHKVLGDKWYVKAAKDLNISLDLHRNGVKNLPPITKYLGKGTPESYARLINFAIYLKNLLGVTNIVSKIHEYTNKEKYVEIDSDFFDSTYFEMKVANLFSISRFKVEFIKEGKKPTPDLRIVSKEGHVILECKKKRLQEKYTTKSIINTIERANHQLKSHRENGLIAIEISLKPVDTDVVDLGLDFQEIQQVIKNMPLVNGVLILNEFVVTDDEKTWNRTAVYVVWNESPKIELPKDLYDTILSIHYAKLKSLLEDD